MKKVLFVDDEPKILGGLERMLRGQRREWEMTFVDSAQAALDALAAAPFDVIVSDMRMPGMDGARLLARVQEQYPRTVRIVLSGHTETEAALRAARVAQQFLSKPCESTVIREVVNRACDLQALLGNAFLRRTLGRIDTLPALPRVYDELITALADPEVSVDCVASIVEQDVGISVKILQLVNSSFFGLRKQIADVRMATTYLGLTMIRDLTLSIEVFRAFEASDGLPEFSLEREQVHATLTARIARRLLSDKVMSAQAFTAAMLHDIGKLILATKLPETYQPMLAASASGGRALYAIEEESNGISHAEIGAYLLGIWGMPYPIVEAVANHHHPARVEQQRFDVLGAVHVANALAHELTGSAVDSSQESELDLCYLNSVGELDALPRWREVAAAEAEEPEVASWA